MATLKW
ncbi:hypothetical protein GQ600_16046 [Phytophthora cactorum]|nr:hypothetical protein GQ600_16046 [Phytophthora cactorum]